MPITTAQRPALDLPDAPRPPRPRATRRAWFWPLVAFAVGLLVFVALLLKNGSGDFYRAGPAARSADGREYAPLPAPTAAGGHEAIGLQRPEPGVELPEPPPAAIERPAPPPPRPVVAAAPRAFQPPQPLAGQTPAPAYPPQALRRGEEGTVKVRVDVGPDGVPTSVSLAESSGSRALDRAAQDAVRRWRFRPAQLDGHATVASVMIPVDFSRDE